MESSLELSAEAKNMYILRTDNSALEWIISIGAPGPMHRDACSSIVHHCLKLEMTEWSSTLEEINELCYIYKM